MAARRLPALAVLVAALVALSVLSARGHADRPARFGSVVGAPMPEADTAGALSSTWYCAAGTAEPGGPANLTVVVANVGDGLRAGTVTWMPSVGDRVVVPVRVGPNAVISLPALASVTAPVVSALVELDGGAVAVEHVVGGPSVGSSVAPCASAASPRWYLANGVTERDARQVLALFNPFPDDAVVDISFDTDQGRDEPRSLQGLPVAAGTTTFVDVHDAVRRRTVTAASVVARTGRLVVDRVQAFDGSAGRTGVSLALAAPAPAATWRFPDGLYGDGLGETWHIYNPSDREAEVTLELAPVTGATPEPMDLTVAPQSEETVDAAATKRVGAGVAHSATFRSLNGVPIVVERAVDARRRSASGQQGSRRGWSSALGAPVTARRWVFPVGEANGNTDEWIVVQNPGAHPITVSVTALVGGQRLAVEGLQDLPVGARTRIAVRLGDHVSRSPLPLEVEATRPVVVERDVYAVGRVGVSAVVGIPVP